MIMMYVYKEKHTHTHTHTHSHTRTSRGLGQRVLEHKVVLSDNVPRHAVKDEEAAPLVLVGLHHGFRVGYPRQPKLVLPVEAPTPRPELVCGEGLEVVRPPLRPVGALDPAALLPQPPALGASENFVCRGWGRGWES